MLLAEYQPDEAHQVRMLERRHDGCLGQEFLCGSIVFQHLDGHFVAPQVAQQYVAELALADALVQQQITLGDHPAPVEKIFRIDAVLLFALLRQTLEQLRAKTVGILFVVLVEKILLNTNFQSQDNSTYSYDLAQILKILLVVDGQLVLQILDPIVLHLVLETHAQRVVAGEVGRFADQKESVVPRLEQVFGFLARYTAMEPTGYVRSIQLVQFDLLK